MRTLLLLALMLCLATMQAGAQAPAPVVWQVNSFDVQANVQQTERLLNGVATINATNIGSASGRTLTLRLNSKASVKSVTVGGAAANYRPAPPERDLQRVEISLPGGVAPNGTVSATVTYSLPVESNSGLIAISPIATQFLPLAFWYPMPNTPYSVRGSDTAPFHLTVNIPNAISSGVEKVGSPGSVTFDQSLYGQPFFLQGDWDKLEGAADAKGVIVMLEKGAGADDRKHAEALMAFTAAARAFFATALGPAPDAPIRLVAVRRGAGFTDGGTVLFDADTLRLPKLDAATALSVLPCR